ncbi:hypothetical protein A2U01_0098171, partial [Trifolium medium]|nr:hypothetical protein [Trifolium medium]
VAAPRAELCFRSGCLFWFLRRGRLGL